MVAIAMAGGPGPGDEDDDDDDAGVGGGSGGNIDPDDDEGYDEEDDDEDEEPLQVGPLHARGRRRPARPARSVRYVLHRTNSCYNRPMRRPASFDGCPPHALPDPGNRIIGF
jgi:hypothetical protein